MNSRRRHATGAVAVLAAAVLISACGSSSGGSSSSPSGANASSNHKTTKVTWLYYGPQNDGGYNVSMWRQAQSLIKAKYGNAVQEQNVANVPYSSGDTQATAAAIRGGANLVIDTVAAGPLFTSACAQYPTAHCIEVQPIGTLPNATSTLPPNVSGIYHAFWDQEYLMGVTAGMLTKSNVIGFVSPYKASAQITSINAMELGCRRVDPKCIVRVVTTNNYFDPATATAAANTLVNAGADVLHGWTDDPSFCKVAEARHVWALGQFTDYRDQCPKAYATGTLWNYGPYFLHEVQLIREGKWKGHTMTLLPIGHGADIAPWGANVPAKVKTAVGGLLKRMEHGYNPFVGPIENANGKVGVPAGKALQPPFLYNGWKWYVKGVVS